MNINTTTDMILAIAEAIDQGDLETLFDCQQINGDWMQTEDERSAMDKLIRSAINAIS